MWIALEFCQIANLINSSKFVVTSVQSFTPSFFQSDTLLSNIRSATLTKEEEMSYSVFNR